MLAGLTKPLRYGSRVKLRCVVPTPDPNDATSSCAADDDDTNNVSDLSGILTATHSALVPIGVKPDAVAASLPLESTIFSITPGDAEFTAEQLDVPGDAIRFGHVVRLIHHARRLHVTHVQNEHAVLERSAQRISLEAPRSAIDAASASRTDRWRILPRYKVRGEGEKICEGDHVIFQSTLATQMLLYVSMVSNVASDGAFEAVCALAKGVGFELQVYDCEDTEEQVIRAGQCVTLLHREENRRLLLLASPSSHPSSKAASSIKNEAPQNSSCSSGSSSNASARIRDPNALLTGNSVPPAHAVVGDAKKFIVSPTANNAPLTNVVIAQKATSTTTTTTTDGNEADTADNSVVLDHQLIADTDPFSKATPSFGNLFLMEHSDRERGGKIIVSTTASYRIRSVSGKYLCVIAAGVNKDDYDSRRSQSASSSPPSLKTSSFLNGDRLKWLLSVTDDPTEVGTLFILEAASEVDGGQLINGSRVFIRTAHVGSGKLWLSTQIFNEGYFFNGVSDVRPPGNGGGGGGTAASSSPASPHAPPTHYNNKDVGIGSQQQQYVQMLLKTKKSVADGFEIQRLPPLEYSELTSVISMLPPLRELAGRISDGSLTAVLIAQAAANIRQLRASCFELHSTAPVEVDGVMEGGVLDYNAQSRLHKQGAAHLLLNIMENCLRCPFMNLSLLQGDGVFYVTSPGAPSPRTNTSATNEIAYQDLAELIQLSLSLLQCMVRNHVTIAYDLRHMFHLLIDCCAVVPMASRCASEFLLNNPPLVYDCIHRGNDELRRCLDILYTRPTDTALLFLVSAFAADGQRSYRPCQDLIGTSFFRSVSTPPLSPPPPPRGAIFLPRCQSDAAGEVLLEVPESLLPSSLSNRFPPRGGDSSTTRAEPWVCIPVRALNVQSAESKTIYAKVVPYLTEAFGLMAALCAGGCDRFLADLLNVTNASVISDLFQSQCIGLVPKLLRASFIHFYTNASVSSKASAASVALASPCVNRIRVVVDEEHLEKIHEVHIVPVAPAHEVQHFGHVKQYAKKFLISLSGDMSAAEGERQHLNAIVHLVLALLKRGAIAAHEVPELAYPLIECLDRRNDSATDDLDVFTDKVTIIEVLEMMMTILVGQTSSRILRTVLLQRGRTASATTETRSSPPEESSNDASTGPSSSLLTCVDDLSMLGDFVDLDTPPEEQQQQQQTDGEDATTRISKITSTVSPPARVRFKILSYLIDTLQDIALVKYWPLRAAAIRLITRLGDHQRMVFEQLSAVFVCGPQHLASIDRLEFFIAELRRYAEAMSNTGTHTGDDETHAAAAVASILSIIGIVDARTHRGRRVSLAMIDGATKPFRHQRSVFVPTSGAGSPLSDTTSPTEPNQQVESSAFPFSSSSSHAAEPSVGDNVILMEYLVHCGVDDVLLALLRRTNRATSQLSPDAQTFVENAVRLTQVLSLQFQSCRSKVLESFSELVFLSDVHPIAFINLVCMGYTTASIAEAPSAQHELSQDVVDAVARLLTHKSEEVSTAAASLLEMLLSVRDASGSYINKHQQMVWKALLQPTVAPILRIVNFHDSSTENGKRLGTTTPRTIVDGVLKNTAPQPKLSESLHLSLLTIVGLAVKQNDTIKLEEVRFELFGHDNAIDTLLTIISDSRGVPTSCRLPYIHLFQNIVVDDWGAAPALLSSKALASFLVNAKCDTADAAAVATNYLRNVRSGMHEPPPQAATEGDIEKEPERSAPICANDVSSGEPQSKKKTEGGLPPSPNILDLTALGLVPCVRHIMLIVSKSNVRLPPRIRNVLTELLNEYVDAVGGLAGALFDSSDETTNCVTNPFVVHSLDEPCGVADYAIKKFQDFFRTAVETKFLGSRHLEVDDPSEFEGWLAKIPSASGSKSPKKKAAKNFKSTAMALSLIHNSIATPLSSVSSGDCSYHWRQYMHTQRHILSDALAVERRYASTARVLLLGNMRSVLDFLTILTRALHFLTRDVCVACLKILIHLVKQRHDEQDADSAFLLPVAQNPSIGDEICVMMNMTADERRDRLASFDGAGASAQLLPLVTDLISSKHVAVRDAALECAIALLDGGHKRMQQILYQSVCERTDEKIFVFLRNEFARTREIIQTYAKVVRKKANPRNTLADLPFSTRLLRFTQLMCEGHYLPLQDYLRVQPMNIVSVNCIESLGDMLDALPLETVDGRTVAFVAQLFTTICETIQGPCSGNQLSYALSRVCSKILAVAVAANLDNAELIAVRTRAVDCLLALLEGQFETFYLRSLAGRVDFHAMTLAMDGTYHMWATHTSSPKHMPKDTSSTKESHGKNDHLNIAVGIYMFLRCFLDHEELLSIAAAEAGRTVTDVQRFVDYKKQVLQDTVAKSSAFLSVQRMVGNVEIVRGDELERCYFRIPDDARRNITSVAKTRLLREVDRSSDTKRLQTFLDQAEQILVEMDFLAAHPMLTWLLSFESWLEDLSLLLVFAINIVMVTQLNAHSNPFDDPIGDQLRKTLFILGVVLAVCYGMIFTVFVLSTMRIHITQCWVSWLKEVERNEHARQSKTLGVLAQRTTKHRQRTSLYSFIASNHVSTVEFLWRSIWFAIADVSFVYKTLFFACSILGITHSLVWFSIPLLHVVKRSPLLSNVILAITTNGKSLILTLILMAFIIYIFGTIAFFYFSELYDPNNNGFGYDCGSLATCWYIHLESIRSGGGVGDIVRPPYFSLIHPMGYGYAFFKLAFFLIIITLFLNIILGIIVDTFAQLREAREFMDSDQDSKCFICGIERNEFDRVIPGGFDRHVASEHNMWSYILLLYHLGEKDVTELNGQEDEVLRRWQNGDVRFFPIGKAKCLTRGASS